MTSKVKKQKNSALEMNISIGRVSLTQKALFAKHLAVMLKSGLTITEALDIAKNSTEGKLKKVLGDVLKSVRSGRSLSESFQNHPKVFSELFINVTYAGEKSGTLVENLENISDELKKEKDLITKVKGAMVYPIVVLGATFALGMVLAFVVLPKITPLFEGLKVDLPVTTRSLIWFSHFIQDYGLYLFFGIIGAIFFFLWLIRQEFSKPVTHKILLNTPILKNLVINTNLSRFARTLRMLLKSGVNIDESLNITKKTLSNYYYRNVLEDVSKRVGMGVKLADAIEAHNNLFPLLLVKMVNVGEQSGKFEDTLFYLADFYEAEVDASTKTLATAIEPALLIFIGLTVGFLALSIITPIYDITGNIQK